VKEKKEKRREGGWGIRQERETVTEERGIEKENRQGKRAEEKG
jgi:hypothetical protein